MNAVIHAVTFLLALALPAAGMSAQQQLEVADAWVREAPPTATVLAAYMVIRNHGATPRTLTAAASERFGSVEIHRTEMKDGMAGMVRIDTLEIPTGGEVRLEPNGYHLMLIGPTAPVRAGESVPLVLTFDAGETLAVEAEVRAGDGMDHSGHEHHH